MSVRSDVRSTEAGIGRSERFRYGSDEESKREELGLRREKPARRID